MSDVGTCIGGEWVAADGFGCCTKKLPDKNSWIRSYLVPGVGLQVHISS